MTRRHSVHKIFAGKFSSPTFVEDNNANTMKSVPDSKGDVTTTPPTRQCCAKRWILAFALCLMHICHAALRQEIAIALVCMTHSVDEDRADDRSTVTSGSVPGLNHTEDSSIEFHWSSVFEGQVLSARYYGYLLVVLLAGYLDRVLGSCRMLMLSLVLGGALSILTPFLTRQHPYLLVANRAAIGAANGVVKPAVFALWANWAPISERASLTSVEFSGSAIGGIITSFVSGFLCSITVDHGWPFVFYAVGAACLLCAVGLHLVVYDSPELHPSVTQAERDHISKDMAHEKEKGKIRAPWMKMMKCSAVWAILIAHSTHHWAYAAIVAYLPMYIRDVLRFNIAQTGMLTAVPFVGSMATGLVAGPLADRMQRRLATVHVRKTFQLAGCVGFAVCMLCVSWLGPQQPWISVSLLVMAVSLLNLTSVAFRINSLDIAPRYASFVTSMSTTIATALSLTAPLVSSSILTTKSETEWRTVLVIVAGVSFTGAVFYSIFARGNVQSWARHNTYDVTLSVSTDIAIRHRKRSLPEDFREEPQACVVLSVHRLKTMHDA